MAAEPRSPQPLVLSIVGTRPEAIKMVPVVKAIAERGRLRQAVVLTRQHADLRDRLLCDPDVAITELDFDPGQLSAGEICERVHHLLCPELIRLRPDLVLVQGDTSSALGGALAARDCDVPVGHVEAGLRTFDDGNPWPEERNRVAIDRLSALLFAPSKTAADALEADGCGGTIVITGNSGIDALQLALSQLPEPALPHDQDRRIILVTCHRRENRGTRLHAVASAIERLTVELPIRIVLPLHSNPHVSGPIRALLSDREHIALVEPVTYREIVQLMRQSWLILTDSGGLQEEGPALGRPVLVLRDVTERREPCDAIALVGTAADAIVAAVSALYRDEEAYRRMATPSLPFGDGRAGPRTAEAIEDWFAAPARLARRHAIRNGSADGGAMDTG